MEFHQSDARFKVPACGRRWGKSRATAVEVLPYMFEPERPGRGWIVAPSYDTSDEFQYMWDDIIIKLGLGSRIKKANNERTGEMYIEMPWGDRVDVKSAKYPQTLVGKGLKWVVLSEAAKLHPVIWRKYIRPALADFHGKAIMPSTPEGFNWYYEVHQLGKVEKSDWKSWNFPSWENKVVYPLGFDDPEVQSQRPTADDTWFWQEIGAQFKAVAGLVYQEWDDEVHIQKWEYDPSLPNYLFIDFGYTNPFVALDVQVTPSDEVHIWREYYVTQKPVHLHAESLVQRENPAGYNIEVAFADSADPGGIETIGAKLCKIMAKNEAKDVMWGIQTVKSFLRSPHGPKMFVDPSCINTIYEFNNYRVREPRMQGAQENVKEEPRKYADHALDAIRYGLMHLFTLGAATHLDDVADIIRAEGNRGIFRWGSGDERITMNSGKVF